MLRITPASYLVGFNVIFYANHAGANYADLVAIDTGHGYKSGAEGRKNFDSDNMACIEIQVNNDNRNNCSSQVGDIYTHIHSCNFCKRGEDRRIPDIFRRLPGVRLRYRKISSTAI
jgi:hypothetical protein